MDFISKYSKNLKLGRKENPPEDFRLLSVIPTIQDLQDPKPFIRKCRIEDGYDSVDHYLDVQFRLLREDFISPLRSGIHQYLEGSQRNRNSDVRVYRNVKLKALDVKEKSVRIELNFGVIKGMNWESTKHFMLGGLLLLSCDDFKTVLFVTIIDRNESQFQKDCLHVEPCQGTKITRHMFNILFVMVESKVYFEPYRAVLSAMQQMNEKNFPMASYLVYGDTNSRIPRYLANTYGYAARLKYKNSSLPIAYDQPWPPAQNLGLNESQYRAFRWALTNDFAVIQGPPGTGKTFVALQIVSALLENKEYWKGYGPLVVVCLTNHALDQFLEGILRYTDSIVRVGSRSKSERMQPYTLMERRKVVKNLNRSEAYSNMNKTKRTWKTQQMIDLTLLKEHLIIGMTTTGAAKLHSTLCALHAPIVLVEEAAEILEAHVVCSMTKHCQQAILIGDHKQLRPKASVDKLGKDYNLNISLFERMAMIRGDCIQLAHQHRMRPEIAKLITPSIYEILYNDESVLGRENIKGLVKNLFFIDHENHESNDSNDNSFANKYESKFLIAFARYLIMQGYEPSEITVLCTYSGQLLALMKETSQYAILKQMHVATVDGYQGEENRIVLLSLVRNNGEGNIGFLKEENRVCVALSRARDGMFIMGNMKDLVAKNTIWRKIRKVLEKDAAIGNALELRCQNHLDEITQIKDVQDFLKCPEGGCLKKCDLPLSCGHSCTSVCHILDRDHKKYSCKQPCIKSCPKGHPCRLQCYQGCIPCTVAVERVLKCGHTKQMLCYEGCRPCTVAVKRVLQCGHTKQMLCYEGCKPCTVIVERVLQCGHTLQIFCSTDPKRCPCNFYNYKCNVQVPPEPRKKICMVL